LAAAPLSVKPSETHLPPSASSQTTSEPSPSSMVFLTVPLTMTPSPYSSSTAMPSRLM
jgi:hypothetical protein